MSTETRLHVDGTRGYAQGEIFLLNKAADGALDAVVYNTTGFGPCPAEEFAAIDTVALAVETGADLAWKNPRRSWMMDSLTIALAGEPADLQGMEFNLVARMQMPPGFNPQQDQSAMAYHPAQIRRVSSYEFSAGMPVFLLRSPGSKTWVMQTFTDHVDQTLTENALPELGDRLHLADGWEFKSVTLDRDLTIDTNGLANIVPDNLANMYQGCIDGVNNFDPWD